MDGRLNPVAVHNQWGRDEFYKLARDAARIHVGRVIEEGGNPSPDHIRQDVFSAWLLCAIPAGNC